MRKLSNALPSAKRGERFDAWWARQGSWVEEPNQRRGGVSGVKILQQGDPRQPILYCKRQTGHLYHSLRHPLGRPTILREHQAYQSFLGLGITVPQVVYCAARKQRGQWQALLVTEALGEGFTSLDRWYENTPAHKLDAPVHHAILRELGTTLARLHLSRWQHGCCYPKHLFVRTQPPESENVRIEIALLDLEKSRRRWRVRDAARHDLGQLWRHRGPMREVDWNVLLEAHDRALASASSGA